MDRGLGIRQYEVPTEVALRSGGESVDPQTAIRLGPLCKPRVWEGKHVILIVNHPVPSLTAFAGLTGAARRWRNFFGT